METDKFDKEMMVMSGILIRELKEANTWASMKDITDALFRVRLQYKSLIREFCEDKGDLCAPEEHKKQPTNH